MSRVTETFNRLAPVKKKKQTTLRTLQSNPYSYRRKESATARA